jgi:acetyl esterase/lipase
MIHQVGIWLLCGISLVSFLLSLWIVIPAPIFALLPLSVGTPEVSPILLALNLGSMLVYLVVIAILRWKFQTALWVALALTTTACILTALPLSQFPKAQQAADRVMRQTLGNDYLAQIPPQIPTKWRSRPLILSEVFRGIKPAPIRLITDLPFAKPAGSDLKLNIYQPPQPGQYPAIVVIYGGAWQRGNPSNDQGFSRYMAAQGYVVWAIAYRHAPQFQFPAQLEDVRSALQFIQNHATEYETDVNRVAIMGRSAGAQLAKLAAFQASPIPIRALVSYYGPVDLTAGYYEVPTPDPIKSRPTLETFLGGSPATLADRYKQASPIQFVKPQLPPSLLIYGKRDHIVQSKYGRHLAQMLTAQGNQAVFVEIPWADHAFDAVFNGLSNQLALYYTERFLGWALR